LIVCGAGDDSGPNLWYRLIVDNRASGAWCININLGAVDTYGVRGSGVMSGNNLVYARRINIGDDQLSAIARQVLANELTNMP